MPSPCRFLRLTDIRQPTPPPRDHDVDYSVLVVVHDVRLLSPRANTAGTRNLAVPDFQLQFPYPPTSVDGHLLHCARSVSSQRRCGCCDVSVPRSNFDVPAGQRATLIVGCLHEHVAVAGPLTPCTSRWARAEVYLAGPPGFCAPRPLPSIQICDRVVRRLTIALTTVSLLHRQVVFLVTSTIEPFPLGEATPHCCVADCEPRLLCHQPGRQDPPIGRHPSAVLPTRSVDVTASLGVCPTWTVDCLVHRNPVSIVVFDPDCIRCPPIAPMRCILNLSLYPSVL